MAISINFQSKEFTKVELYRMTRDNAIVSCKDVEDGTEITVTGYIEYTDDKGDGKTEEVFAMLADDGTCYACTSKTFARNVKEIAEIIGEFPFTIVKGSGTSKAGKAFIMCSLAY